MINDLNNLLFVSHKRFQNIYLCNAKDHCKGSELLMICIFVYD